MESLQQGSLTWCHGRRFRTRRDVPSWSSKSGLHSCDMPFYVSPGFVLLVQLDLGMRSTLAPHNQRMLLQGRHLVGMPHPRHILQEMLDDWLHREAYLLNHRLWHMHALPKSYSNVI